jgi:Flp pilus assembly protein TadG
MVPVLFGLVFGGIDMSRAYLAFNALTNSVREGARYGVVHPTRITAADSADPNNVTAHVLVEAQNATVPLLASNVLAYYVPASGISCASGSSPCDANIPANRAAYIAAPANFPYIRVDVSYQYKPMTPMISSLFGAVLTLRASVTMAIE